MKTYEISSAQNETFRLLKSLLKSTGIVENRQALVFGKKAVADVVKQYPNNCLGFILPEGPEKSHEESQEANLKCIYRLKHNLFTDLDVFGSQSPILLVKVPEMRPWNPAEAEDGCTLLLSFQDPTNIGTILRSAAAFGIKNIILSSTAAHPFHPRSSRAASGSLFAPKYFKYVDSTPLSIDGISIVGLDRNGKDISNFMFPEKFILVPGIEGLGLSKSFTYDSKIGIPMTGAVESLNASIATSIVLQHFFSSRRL